MSGMRNLLTLITIAAALAGCATQPRCVVTPSDTIDCS